jgi:hypothetical protein
MPSLRFATAQSPSPPVAKLSDRVFEARPDLDTGLLPRLRVLPYFREAPPAEIEGSFAVYGSGKWDELCRTWARIAEPTRASLPPAFSWAYAHAGKAPRIVNATVFLDSLRATLAAGERFRARLSPAVHEIVHREFPWLEHRHEHVPEGDTPSFEFPEVFREYIEWGDLDDSRARWQLAVCLNEVQQACYSDFAARLFRLPELHRHAERERELARNYLGHAAPRCTIALWRETIHVLDALNAATFEFVCNELLPSAMGHVVGSKPRARWRTFVANLDRSQRLLAPPEPAVQA